MTAEEPGKLDWPIGMLPDGSLSVVQAGQSSVIYILTNTAMPGLIKIGITNGDVGTRIKQLDTTGIPLPFECFYAAQVTDAAVAEKAIHKAFGDHRVRPSREFFRLSPDKPKAIIELLCLKEVTPGVELFTEAGDKEAVEVAKKKRAIFSFTAAGIRPGTVLQSVFDEAITCAVKGERWVDFRGEEQSLSAAALTVAHEKGRPWTTIAGPDYWKYDGKTLSEIREERSEDEPT